MRKTVVLLLAVFVLAAVALEIPDSITGFFMGVTVSIWEMFKEILKAILLAIANML